MKKKKKIMIFTAGRSDYGYLRPIMKRILIQDDFELITVVSGTHLLKRYGLTYKDIEEDNIPIHEKIKLRFPDDHPERLPAELGSLLRKMSFVIKKHLPHVLIILGDRGEVLVAALAALYLKVLIAHLHGGDRSFGGGFDDSIRHSITKLAHIHFPASKDSAQRLIRMGEEPHRIFITGDTSIDNIFIDEFIDKNELEKILKIKITHPLIVVIQHPEALNSEKSHIQMEITLKAVLKKAKTVVVLAPNLDSGNLKIIQTIKRFNQNSKHERSNFYFIKSLRQQQYFSLLNIADVLVGNSSSGIIETPYLGVPTINIGIRQKGRLHDINVIDTEFCVEKIIKAIEKAMDKEFIRKVKRRQKTLLKRKLATDIIIEVLSNIDPTDKSLLVKKIR